MIVMKFGGTSLGDAERIEQVAGIINLNLDKKPAVVVSAIAGTTDMLLESAEEARKGRNTILQIEKKHHKIIDELGLTKDIIYDELSELNQLLNGVVLVKEITKRTLDHIMSFGERMSSKIVAAAAVKQGIRAKAFNAYDLGFVTDDNYGEAEVLQQTYDNVERSITLMQDTEVPIITGFIAKNKEGDITTIGRGGSDYTAAIIGSAIQADEIQIWTDVDGIMTTDPNIVKEAETVEVISFDEATELAYFGAKILHPKTILPAMKKNIPVHVLNTYNPSGKGTLILRKVKSSKAIVGIVCKKKLSVINIHSERMLFAYGFLDKVFKLFNEHKVPVDMISTSEVNISITLEGKKNIEPLIKDLQEFAEVKVEQNRSSICVVGSGFKRTPNIVGRLFTSLGNENINVEMIAQGASELNLGLVVDDADAEKAVRILHKEFFEAGGESDETGRSVYSHGNTVQGRQES